MNIDPQAAMKIQPELASDENLQWAGMPNPKVIFHWEDLYLVPFSLLWGGFAIFWEMLASGHGGAILHVHSQNPASSFFSAWGIPFVIVGQYLIWGRFVYDDWLKRRTYYAVTNRRVLVLQEAWGRKMSAVYLAQLPTISREGGAIGTLWLGPKYPLFANYRQDRRPWSRFSVGTVPVFADIDDADSLYHLISELREEGARERVQA